VIDYDTIAVAKQHNITLVSFSSLAAGVPGDHPTITAVASRHNVSNAAVMLKYGTFDIVDHSLVSRLHARREPYSTWCPRMHSTCVRMLIG
jgi:diketogulonate reductase-like aldo/keto reductase